MKSACLLSFVSCRLCGKLSSVADSSMKVSAGGVKLTNASSHRYMVFRGGRSEAAPASSLRPGDDVVTDKKAKQPVTESRSLRGDRDLFRIVFLPDLLVAGLSANGIYTKGHRMKSQVRRGGGGCHHQDGATASIPETAAEAEWFSAEF